MELPSVEWTPCEFSPNHYVGESESHMKILESALLLVVGTVMLAFAAFSFGLFPRPLSATNPTLLVEATGIAGALLAGLGSRGLYRVQLALQNHSYSSAAQ